MAKKPIPSLLVTALAVIALVGAALIHFDLISPPLPRLDDMVQSATKTTATPSLLPPEDSSESVSSRADEALFQTWRGHPVPEILAALTSAANPSEATSSPSSPEPIPELTLVESTDFDPYLPRFAAKASSEPPLPAFDHAAVLNETLLFSKNGEPLTLGDKEAPFLESTGGSRLLPGDFDGDGDIDLFIGRSQGLPSSLLRQNAEGKFDDITTASGLLAFLEIRDAAWVDFDRDGRLDLFTVAAGPDTNSPSRLRLYRNLDGNRFRETEASRRLPVTSPVVDFLWRDIDGDRFPDLILSTGGESNALMLLCGIPAEQPAQWDFSDGSDAFGFEEIPAGGPIASGDFDRNGTEELLVAAEDQISILSRNVEDDPFTPFIDVSEVLELDGIPSPSCLLFEDLDGDGFLDLALTGGTDKDPASRAWWNVGGLRFRKIPGAAGLSATLPLTEIIRVDPDRDGIASLVLSAGNQVGGLALDPTEEALKNNAHAIVQLRSEQVEDAAAQGALLSIAIRDGSATLSIIERRFDEEVESIGLGEAIYIESIAITWPNQKKTVTLLKNLPANHQLAIGPDPKVISTSPLPKTAAATGLGDVAEAGTENGD